MNGVMERLGKINPLIWVVVIIAAILGYGAQKLVVLMNIPEEKRQKVVIALKSAAMLLAILAFILIITI